MNTRATIRDLVVAGILGGLLMIAGLHAIPPRNVWWPLAYMLVVIAGVKLNAEFPAGSLAQKHGRFGASLFGMCITYLVVGATPAREPWFQGVLLCLMLVAAWLMSLALRAGVRAVNDPAEGPSATPSFGRDRNGALDAKEQG